VPLLVVLLLAALLLGPQLWARRVLARHAVPRTDVPGTGAEFAHHLVTRAGLSACRVEAANPGLGDHYDPLQRCVRLAPAHHDARSLAALVVAAHEVGHAIQAHIGYAPLRLRTRLVGLARLAERAAGLALVLAPAVAALTRSPALAAAAVGLGLLLMLVPVAVHLVTLPVEFDASFRRALPILALGYLEGPDLVTARRLLLACALTYVAGALASLLNLWRWLAVLRR